MKKCASCGKENIDKAIFCANCGARLDTVSKDSSYYKSAETPALNALKNHIAEDSSSPSSSESSTSNSNTNQKKNQGPSNFRIFCCYVPLIFLIVCIVGALVYYGAAESFNTGYPDDFEKLDANGDGKLVLDEILQVYWIIDDSTITKYFNEADINNNGYLKGHEFDIFGDDVVSHIRHSEDSSSDSDKYQYSSSSSSSGSSSKGHDYSSGSSKATNSLNNQEFDRSEGYVLTCPYCGSEAIYETGGYYRCAECGSNIYDPDDLELGYVEGYMELLAPVLSIAS